MEGLLELDRIGKLVAGKYRLELVLGRGGMGTVYRATHTWTGRAVAVKYLHPDHAQDTASVARFLREARAAASVGHPNAVDVLDMGQDADGSAYLVLELLEGTTLAEHIAANTRLEPAAVARLLAPVLEALEELHRVGVVHRDFKPANIFLSVNKRGQVVPKLLDFGVAKVLDEDAATATTTGIVVGTPAYMAPEQAAGNGEIGPWTDLWAVGAVLYQCLVGELPFMAPTPSLMLVDVMTKNAPKLASRRPDLPAAICAVVDRALTKDPKARYESAAKMAEALCQATGIELSSQTGPLPDVASILGTRTEPPASTSGSRAEPPASTARGSSTAPPALATGETIQLSSDSMMVAAALPNAPTMAATPVRPRSLPPPPLPGPLGVEAGASASEQDSDVGGASRGRAKDEKKHWAGPSATGRLQAPRLGRARVVIVGASVVALGIAGWWLFGTDNFVPSSASLPASKDVLSGQSPSSSPPPSSSPGAVVPQRDEPALAPQPDASTVEQGQAERSVAGHEPDAPMGDAPRAANKPGRGAASRAKVSRSAPKPATAVLPMVAPPQPPSGKGEGASPPAVVREW